MVPEQLALEVQQLQTEGHEITTNHENGVIALIFHDYNLPEGYSKETSDLLLRIPEAYPHGKPDMFWVDEDLVLANGSVPKKGAVIEVHTGIKWRRISWHPTNWNPGVDNLHTYLSFVHSGLTKAAR